MTSSTTTVGHYFLSIKLSALYDKASEASIADMRTWPDAFLPMNEAIKMNHNPSAMAIKL